MKENTVRFWGTKDNKDIGAEPNSLLELNGLLRVLYSCTVAQRKSSQRD